MDIHNDDVERQTISNENLITQYKKEVEELNRNIEKNRLGVSTGALASGMGIGLYTILETAKISGEYDPSEKESLLTNFTMGLVIGTGTVCAVNSLSKLITNISKETQAELMVDLLEKGLLDSNIKSKSEQAKGTSKTLKK